VTGFADLVLLAVIVLDLWVVATSRIGTCVRAAAFQGAVLALLPGAFWIQGFPLSPVHLAVMTAGTLAIKGILIPILLFRAILTAQVHREVEPFVSLHISVIIGAVFVGFSFWLGTALVLPNPPPSALVVPAAFSNILIGFLVLVSRRKAVTQVVGYLLVENGIFIIGQTLAHRIPFVVELGILLDLLVGIFVMGIAIHHIRREFDHIDTELLASLKE
jgi:hydrogenase-4 component E